MIKNIGEYTIDYFEIEQRSFGLSYRPIARVLKNNELILSSENFENEEFYNYLKFLVPNDIFEATKMILECGHDSDDFEIDYWDENYFDDCCSYNEQII